MTTPADESSSDASAASSQPTGEPNPPDTSTQPEPFDPYRFGPPGPNPYGYPEYPTTPAAPAPGVPSRPPTSYPSPGSLPPYGGSPPPMQYQQYPGVYPVPPPVHQYVQPRTGNGRAIASLVLGILSIFFSLLSVLDIPLFVLGIVFGVLGLRAARQGAGGRTMAAWGLALAIIGGVLCLVFTGIVAKRIVDCGGRYDTGTVAYEDCLRTGN